MKEYYELFGLTESATDEELEARYEQLKAKYREESFLEGEAGNDAAKMLHKVNVAYQELMLARKQAGTNTTGDSSFEEIEKLIKDGDLTAAQTKLDAFDERSAEWHYVQSRLFFRKDWLNESKKQLEIALQMEPDNQKYKHSYELVLEHMNYRSKSGGEQNKYNPEPQETEGNPEAQMGGNGCVQCLNMCYTCLCINCIFNICCGCR